MLPALIEKLASLPLDGEVLDAQGNPSGKEEWDYDVELPAGHQVFWRSNDDAQRLLNSAIVDARSALPLLPAVCLVAVAVMDGLHQDSPIPSRDSYYDRAYAISDAGFPGVWTMCVEMAEVGVELYGEAWETGAREFVDDIQNIMPIMFDGQELSSPFAEHAEICWKKLP